MFRKMIAILSVLTVLIVLLVGCTGTIGPAGVAGPAGEKGSTGAIGPVGEKGATGANGATGPAGPTGANGAGGQAGVPGIAGAIGPVGLTGPAGASGVVSNWVDYYNPAPPLEANEHITNWYQAAPFPFLSTVTANNTERLWRFADSKWSIIFTGPVDYVRANGSTVYALKTGTKAGGFINVSTNNGTTFTQRIPVPPEAGGALKDWCVLVNATTILYADVDAIYKTTNNGTSWTKQSCPVGTITSMKRAGNSDINVVGVDSAGKVRMARQLVNTDTWAVIDTPIPLSSNATFGSGVMALGYPTRNGMIATAVTKDGNSGIWTWFFDNPGWVRIDGGNILSQGGYMSNGAGAVGNTDEGNGNTYVVDGTTSIVRLKGLMTQADRITIPSSIGTIVFMGTAFVDTGAAASSTLNLPCGIDTDGDGKAEKVMVYRDSLNTAVTGVKANPVSGTSATISWTSNPGATNYAVFVSKTKQTNYYTAKSDLGIGINYNPGGTAAWVNGLSPTSVYYVTVWANAPVTSFYGSANFSTTAGP